MKFKALVLSLCLQLLALVGFGQVKILYYKDESIGTDQMAQALAGLGAGYTVTTAVSDADFQTKISTAGAYDLGIFFKQNFSTNAASTAAITALADFMDAGGRAIYADWTQENTLAIRFGAAFTFADNDPTVTITDACLATDIGTNPMTLTNPGWGIFSTGLVPLLPLPSSTSLATFGNGSAAVVRNGNGRALVIGFLNDTPPAADGVQFFKNTITCGSCDLATNFNSNPTVSQTPACAGANIKVSFTVKANPTCPFPAGNVFTVELSDASGSFAAPVNLGTVSPGINNVTVPQSTPTGSGYRVRIAATTGGSSVYSNVSAAFTVNQPSFAAAPTVSLDNKCAGQAVRLSFGIRCTFFAGNTFTAELSDASGSFAAPVSLGPVTPGAMNNVVIPAGTPPGTGYKIRVVSSNPAVTSPASGNVKVKVCGPAREAAPEETGLQVRVSPNPSPEGRLRIHVSGAEGQALKVALFSGTGQPVREQAINRASETETLDWDITRQPAGLYLLRVSGGKESKTVKVLH